MIPCISSTSPSSVSRNLLSLRSSSGERVTVRCTCFDDPSPGSKLAWSSRVDLRKASTVLFMTDLPSLPGLATQLQTLSR